MRLSVSLNSEGNPPLVIQTRGLFHNVKEQWQQSGSKNNEEEKGETKSWGECAGGNVG
jgi:hypothetical protein